MLKAIKVFTDSENQGQFQCALYFEGTANGYMNTLSRDTILHFESSGVRIYRLSDKDNWNIEI